MSARTPSQPAAPDGSKRMLWFSPRVMFWLDVASSVVSLLARGMAIYFLYLWAITLGKVDTATRRLLLGRFLADLLDDNMDMMYVVAALYIGYSLLLFLVTAADWRQRLEESRLVMVRSERNFILS